MVPDGKIKLVESIKIWEKLQQQQQQQWTKKKNKNKTTPEAQTASRSSENFEKKYDTVLTVSSHLKRQNETASWTQDKDYILLLFIQNISPFLIG